VGEGKGSRDVRMSLLVKEHCWKAEGGREEIEDTHNTQHKDKEGGGHHGTIAPPR
jgi:hypothetical protein